MKKLIIFLFLLLIIPIVSSELVINHQEYLNVHAFNSSGSYNSNVDGSATNQIFSVEPPVNETYYLARLIFNIEDNAVFAASKYGGLAALTNGYYIRVNQSGVLTNITSMPIHKLTDIGQMSYDLQLHEFGSGNNFAQVRWTITKGGTYLKLNGSNSDSLDIIIRDDLTALVSNSFVAQGFKLNESKIDTLPEENMNTTTAFGMSFSTLIIVFLVLLALGAFSLAYFRNPAAKTMSVGFMSLILLYLLRFVGWFMEIVNPDQLELIDTLNHLYGFSVYILKGTIYICIALTLYYGIKSLNDSSKRKTGFQEFDKL